METIDRMSPNFILSIDGSRHSDYFRFRLESPERSPGKMYFIRIGLRSPLVRKLKVYHVSLFRRKRVVIELVKDPPYK